MRKPKKKIVFKSLNKKVKTSNSNSNFALKFQKTLKQLNKKKLGKKLRMINRQIKAKREESNFDDDQLKP